MKARYIGNSNDKVKHINDKDPFAGFKNNPNDIEEFTTGQENGKVYEIVAIPSGSHKSPIMNKCVIVIHVYNLGKISWTTIGYKTLENFIKVWDFNVDPSEIAEGQDQDTLDRIGRNINNPEQYEYKRGL